MPSEIRTRQALEALAAPRETFRSAVAVAVDQVGAYLAANRGPTNGRAERVAHELGDFAAGRLDAGRFAGLFGQGGTLEPLALARMERAYDMLKSVSEAGPELFVTHVAPGADLRTAVRRSLAEIGRAFGAARTVSLARRDRGPTEDPDAYAGGFGFRSWNRAERQIAPPLVVEVEGDDLQPGGLAEFLDGTQKIVLVVRGPAPAAALVRLITPGVFVMQTPDTADLARLAAIPGPGILALMPEDAARFTHLPGDAPLGERLTLISLPDGEPRVAVGSHGVFQQAEELKLLRALAETRGGGKREEGRENGEEREARSEQRGEEAGSGFIPQSAIRNPQAGSEGRGDEGSVSPDPAGRLASYLLSESGFGGPAPVAAAAPAPAPAPAAAVASAGGPDAADKLAAWLLSRTDLSGT
jgi:hypothetical protein